MESRRKPVSKRSGHGANKNSQFKKNMLKALKIFISASIVLACILGGLISGAIAGYIKTTVPITPEQLKINNFKTFIYDDTGKNIIGELTSSENRIWVDYDDVPKYLRDALVAIEDERFEKHSGVDLIGLLRAVFKKITNPSTPMAGASTITQQVIKNITGEDQRSIQRKVQEQWRAIMLEKKLAKWEILQIYMNVICTGVNMYGVQVAANTYFNKDVSELTLAECASIAGITNNPAKYNPFTTKGRENNKKRQMDVLRKMLELGFITQEEYDTASKEELKFFEGEKQETVKSSYQSYFVDQVVLDVKKDLMAQGMSETMALNLIYNTGLKIYTTMNTEIQNAVDEVFLNDNYFPVTNPYGEHPQAAIVIIDPQNGHVKAMYGGYGEKKGNTLNRATQIKRQPGSSLKPLAVYAPAINEGLITAATIIDDVPVYMNGIENGRYPENYERTFNGLIPVRDALRMSLNVVAAKIWRDILGPDLSLSYLKKVGIERTQRNVSLSLGGLDEGVSPLQMAAAYVPFANRGIYYQPITYLKVEDASGKVILEKKTQKPAIVYSEQAAYIMTSMLQDVCTNGTAYPYGIITNSAGEQIWTAGKTGTTDDDRNKWFVGYSPYYVCASWYGYDSNAIIPAGIERNQALNLWHEVMQRVHASLEPVEYEMPAGIETANVCIRSGKLTNSFCIHDPIKVAAGVPQEAIRYGEVFIKGTAPSSRCDVHISAKVCTESTDLYGRPLLAGSHCPSLSIIERVFIHRKEPFTPIMPDDPYPLDFMYDYTPAEYCNVHGPH